MFLLNIQGSTVRFRDLVTLVHEGASPLSELQLRLTVHTTDPDAYTGL